MTCTATTFLASILLPLIAFSDAAVVPGNCGEEKECVPYKSCKVTLDGLAIDLIQSSMCHLDSLFPVGLEANINEMNSRMCCGEKKTCCDIKDIIEPEPTTPGTSVEFPVENETVDVDGLRELGSLTTFLHEVSGTVFELNEEFLLIKDFNYDGRGFAPIFLAGTTGTPSGDGEVVLPYPIPDVEKTFSIDDPDLPKLPKQALHEDVKLKLPPGFKVDQLKWISLWCTAAKLDFGSLQIIKDIPQDPQEGPSQNNELGDFITTKNGTEVSGTVFKLNERELKIEDFNYSDKGLARAIFLAGTTGAPSGDGEVVLPYPVPDVERTFSISDKDLPRLDNELHGDITLKLPKGFKVDQLMWIAVWCTKFKEVFGILQIK